MSSPVKTRLGNTRTTGKEQFYTPPQLAKTLIQEVANLVPDLADRTMIEPAGGTGAFIKAAKKFGITKIISFDMGGTSTDVAVCVSEILARLFLSTQMPPVDEMRLGHPRSINQRTISNM